MDHCTEIISKHIKRRGTKLTKLSRDTRIPYEKVWRSLSGTHTRALTADEYMKVCDFLDLDPVEIYKS